MKGVLGKDDVLPTSDIWVADIKTGNTTNVAMANIRRRTIPRAGQFEVHIISN
jgi:hypothetical protein